jgi:excisionase family DNA binding protein
MNTNEAATLAGVTPRTIRRWAAAGRIPATRTTRGWTITPTATVTIGRRSYTLQEPAISAVPITLSTRTGTRGAPLAAVGDADELRTAFETGTQITLSGKCAGERIYLGHTRQTYNDGITLETIGLDRTLGESPKYPGHTIAAYLVDMTRLDDAPTLAALKAKHDADTAAAAMEADARAEREERRHLDREDY